MSHALAQHERDFARARLDFEFFCNHFVYILTKNDGLQRFFFNYAQKQLWKRIQEEKKKNKALRIIILKARQMGMSTFIQAYLFWKSLTAKETASMVLAHDEESSAELFSKIELMYDQLSECAPLVYQAMEKVKDTSKKGKKKAWKAPLLTSISVQTAGNKKAGRSRTIRRVHLSELAFYEDPSTLLLGLSQAVGRGPDTEIFVESTANGIGNYFHKLWKRAKSGESGYIAVFFGWNEEPAYKAIVPDIKNFKLSKEEKKIKRKYKLSYEQLQWRRETIADECEGDVDKFKQEYPLSDHEAFLVSGNPYFGRKVIETYSNNTTTPLKYGYLEFSGKKPEFIEVEKEDEKGCEDAPWRIFKKPIKYRPYAIGADPAGGTSKDYSFATVLDLLTLETVATCKIKCDPDDFARELSIMGRTYSLALIAPEKNGEGRATVLKLKKDLQYPRVFYHVFEDQWENGVQSNDGWRTSAKTRPTMLAQTSALLRDNSLRIYDDRIVDEMLSFVRVETSKIAEAQEGMHDDGVMSLCIVSSDEVRQQGAVSGDMEADLDEDEEYLNRRRSMSERIRDNVEEEANA